MGISDVNLRSRCFSIKGKLYAMNVETLAMVAELEKIADALDEHFKNITKAKVGGSTAAILGGILAGIGFGLSFATFGASLGLCIAGKSS